MEVKTEVLPEKRTAGRGLKVVPERVLRRKTGKFVLNGRNVRILRYQARRIRHHRFEFA